MAVQQGEVNDDTALQFRCYVTVLVDQHGHTAGFEVTERGTDVAVASYDLFSEAVERVLEEGRV